MPRDFIQTAIWDGKIMPEKERWIKSVCKKLKDPILKLRYLEHLCSNKLKGIPSILFLAVYNKSLNAYVVVEENAPGSIETYLNEMGADVDDATQSIYGICSSAMDSVEAVYKVHKFSNPLKMQQQQIEHLKKELATIEGDYALVWNSSISSEKNVCFGHQELEEDLQLRELVTIVIVNRKRLIM